MTGIMAMEITVTLNVIQQLLDSPIALPMLFQKPSDSTLVVGLY